MKNLFIIRHAKSSWEDFGISDIDRPLNSRGIKDAYAMGIKWRKAAISFDKIISSNGIRALHTATIIANQLNIVFDNLEVNPKLYHASFQSIFEIIHCVSEDVNNLAIFAHNPGITDFAYEAKTEIENVPTTGMIHFTIESTKWKDADFSSLLFKDFDYPKRK